MFYNMTDLLETDQIPNTNTIELKQMRLMLKKEIYYHSGESKQKVWACLDKVLAELNKRGIIAL